MRYARHSRATAAPLKFNATPMVDVIFMLTIFFMLVTRFSSAEQVPMELPNPDGSKAEVTRIPDRVVINCRLAAADATGDAGVLFSIGPNRAEPLGAIDERLGAMKLASPDLKVVVRADRRLSYAQVRGIMRVIASHGIDMLNVVAHVEEGD